MHALMRNPAHVSPRSISLPVVDRAVNGLLVINKPQGLSSHAVTLRARRRLGIKRIGHAGTLDPMARGVLVLLVGQATKWQDRVLAHRKIYHAVIRLGTQTDTADAWGRVIRAVEVPTLRPDAVRSVLASLTGLVTQRPPAFSAVKVLGRPMYWWARHGQTVTAPVRTIEIVAMDLLRLEVASLTCRIECSSGTYVRSLAETIAERLGTVGHLSELVRLSVGHWSLAQARSLDWLMQASVQEVAAAVRPIETLDECADRA